MGKVKINNNIAALLIVVSIFAGFETLLIVTVLMAIFCDMNDKVKPLVIKVVSFMAGIALLSLGWNLISKGINLVFDLFENIVKIINSYLSYSNQIKLTDFNSKFADPIKTVVSSIGLVISYLITLSKFGFIVAVISGKAMKETAWTKKVEKFVSKFVNFSNSYNETNSASNMNNASNNVVSQNDLNNINNTNITNIN